MTDHFATLQMPRRPWLDAGGLRAAYQSRAASAHPDVAGDAGEFMAINAAYAVLREPGSRLRHLLEMEFPEVSASASVPASLSERFMEVATLQREAEVFLKQQGAVETPLAKALLASDRAEIRRDVERLSRELERDAAELDQHLQAEDATWEMRNISTAARLVDLQKGALFLAKWREQVRETLLLLDL